MIKKAEYTSEHGTLSVELERIDILIKSTHEIVNFPRLIELEDDRLVLPYGRGRHGGDESRLAAHSEDGGRTWDDCPPDSPWNDNVQTSGVLGYMRDGSISYVDVFPLETGNWKKFSKPWFQYELTDPTWRFRRFASDGELLEDATFHVSNLPWRQAAYFCYGDLLDLGGGELFMALGAQLPADIPEDGGVRITTFFVRSSDNGKSFEYVNHITPELDGRPFGPQGFSEPTMVMLPGDEILCVLRTGSRSPLYQVRSADLGKTWSTPESTGWPSVKPDLCVLSNGVLACSSGRGSYGHPQVTHVMFSIDGRGEHWEPPFIFHTGPGCSYTSNMEKDGRLYVAYSDSSFTRDRSAYDMPYQAIKWAVLNVTKK